MNFGDGDPSFRVHIREYTPQDLEACLAIYASNLDFLPDRRDEFIEFLDQGTSWYLVAEVNGKVAACGGVEIAGDTNASHFWYGMVEQQYQRRGLGTLMTLSRLALVPKLDPAALVTMETRVITESFYRRFGFERVHPDQQHDPASGWAYVGLGLWLTAGRRREIRRTLASCPATFADGLLLCDT